MGIILESKIITYHADDIIYKEDDKGTQIYFINDGEIELSKKSRWKTNYIIIISIIINIWTSLNMLKI